MLVAVVMLFVVGAMAALSIDAVTLYTARSEAQLAADGAALAGARVLANSGMTSDATGGFTGTAETQAKAVATEVAQQNLVGGRNLTAPEVTSITFTGPPTNPRITVHVQRTDLPTFFARIWGRTQVTVGASATAEAYNPSGANALVGTTTPVALTCVKPWLLPNLDPTSTTSGAIFVTSTGAITNTGLLGLSPFSSTPIPRLEPACTDCSGTLGAPTAWQYYPGDTATTFAPPTQALPTCNPPLATNYEKSIAGCVLTPISCGTGVPNGTANIDFSNYDSTGNRRQETARAVNCLAHTAPGADEGDTVDTTGPPTAPFEFIAGQDNPIALANPSFAGKEMMVSDSLVTVPVFNSSTTAPTNPVTIIGFVQLFLNPDGIHTPTAVGPNQGYVNATIVNMAGCGTGATGTPILGNGNSPVAVRLISGP